MFGQFKKKLYFCGVKKNINLDVNKNHFVEK
jgi:hypothetical protein